MQKKIIFSFIITIFLISTMGILSIVKMQELSDLTQDLYEHPLHVTNSTKTIQANIISMHRYMKDVVLSKNDLELKKALKEVERSEKIVYKEFKTIFNRYLGDKKDIEKSYIAFVNWKPIRDEIIQLVAEGKKTQAADITKGKGAKHVKMLNNQICTLIKFAQKKADYFLKDSLITKQNAIYLTSIALIMILVIISSIFIFLLRKFIKSKDELEKNGAILLQQSRLAQMGEMISMIAHQWRQPLATISSTSIDLQLNIQLGTFDLETEKGRNECAEYFQDGLTTVDSLVQTLTTTIDDFRNFYKPNKISNKTLIKSPIIKSLKIIRKSLESNNIDIVQNYNTTKEVEVYISEFMQVILNILKNAEDNFLDKKIKGAKIVITSNDTENGVSVTIEDNGGGIEDAVLPNIFDPYFSTKSEKNGTGLGLYMSKIIIEEHHNGKLDVNSKNGSTSFSILLNDKLT